MTWSATLAQAKNLLIEHRNREGFDLLCRCVDETAPLPMDEWLLAMAEIFHAGHTACQRMHPTDAVHARGLASSAMDFWERFYPELPPGVHPALAQAAKFLLQWGTLNNRGIERIGDENNC